MSAPDEGFSLIELLIGVAVAGILAAIAVPSYTQYLQQSRRADAVVFLSQAAGEQTRFFSDRNAYAATMAELGYGEEATFPTPEGYYTVSIERSTAGDYYMLKATPAPEGPQSDDTACGTFSITSTGARTASGGAGCW